MEPQSLICPRCGRKVEPWPVERADVCSPKDWEVCIRTFENIEKERERKSEGKGKGEG